MDERRDDCEFRKAWQRNKNYWRSAADEGLPTLESGQLQNHRNIRTNHHTDDQAANNQPNQAQPASTITQ